MAEPRIFDLYSAPIHVNALRAVRDYLGFRAWVPPAQISAYVDLGKDAHRSLLEHTIAGIPCFQDVTAPKDRIDFIDAEGRVLARMINMAIPVGY